MERLTGPARNNIPKAPSLQKPNILKKSESNNRTNSQQKPGNNSVKKDSAKQMLMKMKQIKAQYNNRANSNKNQIQGGNIINKIS